MLHAALVAILIPLLHAIASGAVAVMMPVITAYLWRWLHRNDAVGRMAMLRQIVLQEVKAARAVLADPEKRVAVEARILARAKWMPPDLLDSMIGEALHDLDMQEKAVSAPPVVALPAS